MAQRKSAGSRQPASVGRNIHFFRADVGLGAGGQPEGLDIGPVLDQVGQLAFEDDKRYVAQDDDGNVLSCSVDSTPSRQRLLLATVRRTGLPLVEAAGGRSAFSLAANQGLFEGTHIVFFPSNVIGVEFNFFGPRPSRVPWYLNKATKGKSPTFTLDPLLRQDVVEQLNRMEQVRVLTLAIRPSYATTVAEADRDLASAFRAAERAGGSQLVHLRLGPESHGRSWLAPRALQTARGWLTRSYGGYEGGSSG